MQMVKPVTDASRYITNSNIQRIMDEQLTKSPAPGDLLALAKTAETLRNLSKEPNSSSNKIGYLNEMA